MIQSTQYQTSKGLYAGQTRTAGTKRHAPIPVWNPKVSAVTPFANTFMGAGANTWAPGTERQSPTVLQVRTALQVPVQRSRKRRRPASLYWAFWLFALPCINTCVFIGLLAYTVMGQKASSAPVPVVAQPILPASDASLRASTSRTAETIELATATAPNPDNALLTAKLQLPPPLAVAPETPTNVVLATTAEPGKAVGNFRHPVSGFPLSSPFGQRIHPISKQVRFHAGADFATPTGTPVKAAEGGRISRAGRNGGYGNVIEIDHGNGFRTRYAHLDGFKVQVNDLVAQQDVIGFSGNTGYSTGPHLHFEVRLNGQPQDPLTLLVD